MSSDFEDRLAALQGKIVQLPLNYTCLLDRYFSVTDISIAILDNGIQHRNAFNVPNRMARAQSFLGWFCMAA